MLVTLLCAAMLSACGGQSGPDQAPLDSQSAMTLAGPAATSAPAPATNSTVDATATTAGATATTTDAGATTTDATIAPPPSADLAGNNQLASTVTASTIVSGATVTSVKFESTGTAAQQKLPFTFGQYFADGDFAATDMLTGKLSDGTIVPLQVDVKATHADQSVRHAIISGVLPALAAGQTVTMALVKGGIAAVTPSAPVVPLPAPFSTKVIITVDGQVYTASAELLLRSVKPAVWLNGPVATELDVATPLKNASGVAHPHLAAHFDVRSYAGGKTKVDVIVENDWAYEPGPRNFVYDVQVTVGGQSVYSKTGLTHYHHARWKKTFWYGGEPQVNIRHDAAYLMASKAVPNYDKAVVPSTKVLNLIRTSYTGAVTEPMQRGMALAYMPNPGGRWDIALQPGWVVTWLLSMDKDTRKAALGTADAAGSWSVHYRDRNTGRVVSLLDYPYMTILGHPGDAINPATKKSEGFPVCGGDCKTPLSADSAHEPDFAYLPYLLTGDHYYLEEMQFYAMYNMFQANPYYRDFAKGLLKSDQLRGQAWSMRALAEAAAVTPDADPLKVQFNAFLSNNIDYYTSTYVTGSATNALGVITDPHAVIYNSGRGVAPWQDDFFTQAVGRTVELGFSKAKPLLTWKSKFPVLRMVDSGSCWIDAAMYSMNIRDSATAPFYSTMKQVYLASETAAVSSLACNSPAMAAALKLHVGEMAGYAYFTEGFPSMMQPALAYSVDAGNPDAARAWSVFQARAIKPVYADSPEYAIVPR